MSRSQPSPLHLKRSDCITTLTTTHINSDTRVRFVCCARCDGVVAARARDVAPDLLRLGCEATPTPKIRLLIAANMCAQIRFAKSRKSIPEFVSFNSTSEKNIAIAKFREPRCNGCRSHNEVCRLPMADNATMEDFSWSSR